MVCFLKDTHLWTLTIETHEQYGTYWYHSHIPTQYSDDLYGPLIIHRRNDPYKTMYDEERILTVAEWFHVSSQTQLISRRIRGPQESQKVVLVEAILINGKGRFNCTHMEQVSKYYEGLLPRDPRDCRPYHEREQFNVTAGKRYRFRIVNSGSRIEFNITIDNHNMTVIDLQGTDMVPRTVQELQLAISARYDVIVEMNQPVDNY